jgi:acetoacetyl-CoA reductase/3-oxoacyl-[acyl-carrier protein] reductase
MIIITGASRGIGQYLYKYFNAVSNDVIGFYNSTRPSTSESNYLKVDITREEEIKEFISNNREKLKNLILINAAGISLAGFSHKLVKDDWKTTFDVNTTGAFLMIRYLLPIMREENFGRIINISSVVPQVGTIGNVAYASSKSALWGLTKVIANENAERGITANCLNLGYFDIGMIESIPEKILDKIIETIPMKKLGSPINIVNAINFLIESDYVTGTGININGGRY